MSCQKRVHKSMQEMVAYLLGLGESYCTHEFRILYYTNLVHLAEALSARYRWFSGWINVGKKHVGQISAE